MKINKLSDYVYYYTDTVSDEEYQYVMSILNNDAEWEQIHTYGPKYEPGLDPDEKSSQSIMNAYRKAFVIDDINKDERFSAIINRVFNEAVEHYRKERNISGEKKINPYTHIDKHLIGTSYRSHVDTVAPGENGMPPEGYTVLLYMNDEYDGGEISFSFDSDFEYSSDWQKHVFDDGPIPTYHPEHEKNKDKVAFWIKPGKMSVLIFPPVYPPHPHTAHTVLGDTPKYLIKNYWEVGGQPEHWNNK